MDVIPSDNNNIGIGGMNHKTVQAPQQEESLKNPEKVETGSAMQQGDKVEITSVLPKKDESGVKGFSLKDNETRYTQILAETKDLITQQSHAAIEAQAGSGSSFLKALYPG